MGKWRQKVDPTEVSVQVKGGALVSKSPYHETLVEHFRSLGGVWKPEDTSWRFKLEHEAKVRELLRHYVGGDGTGPLDTVTVHVRIGDHALLTSGVYTEAERKVARVGLQAIDSSVPSIKLFGRELVYRWHAGHPVRYGRGVSLVEGNPFSEGVKGAEATAKTRIGGTLKVLQVEHVSRADALQTMREQEPGAIWIVDQATLDRTALEKERQLLRQRLAAIDVALSEPPAPSSSPEPNPSPEPIHCEITFDDVVPLEWRLRFLDRLKKGVESRGGKLLFEDGDPELRLKKLLESGGGDG